MNQFFFFAVFTVAALFALVASLVQFVLYLKQCIKLVSCERHERLTLTHSKYEHLQLSFVLVVLSILCFILSAMLQ